MATPERDRQVLVTKTLELAIVLRFHLRQQLGELDGLRQRIQHLPVTFVHGAIEGTDRVPEVLRGNVVVVREVTAAQHVEQHIGVVPNSDVLLGRCLEAVTHRHDLRELVGTFRDRLPDGGRKSGRLGEFVAQRDDVRLAELDVGNDLPAAVAFRRQLERLVHQERAADAALVRLGLE